MSTMLEAHQLNLFDNLVQDTHRLLQEKERLEGQYIDVVVKIGQNLLQMRPHKPYGQFIPWVEAEFKISRYTANNYIHVAEAYANNVERVLHLPLRVVYELSAPSMTEAIREQVEQGQIAPTVEAIRDAKRELYQPVITPTLTEHDAALSGYRGYDRWQEAHKWEEKQRTFEAQAPEQVTVREILLKPDDELDKDADDEEEEYEETEEDRYETAAATGTLDYYYADLRREAMLRDEEEREKRRGAPAALQMSESNEWYTPGQYVEAARLLMGNIDIDPASNALANETIQAATYYDIETNGLDKDWAGRVWLNPPYGREGGDSNQEIWSHRLIEQFQSGITTEAVLLVNANTEAKWFQPLYDYLICFTNHRIRFYNTEGTSSQPTQGNALIYFGPQKARFTELFKQFGPIVRRIA